MITLLFNRISIMSVSFPNPTAGQQVEAAAFGSKMEAATEALLRIRDEIVITLDRQVMELQQMHRALSFAPPPMIVTDDTPRPSVAEAPPSSPSLAKPSLFEDAPRLPNVPVFAALPVAVMQMSPATAPMSQQTVPQPTSLAVATMEEVGISFDEPMIDPSLERATLDELNDALASAFAMVSLRADH